MLRIRIGRRWTRERGAAPHDSVSLELDGVALVDGAEDEPLLPLVESLLGCTGALARGTPMADISLPESGLVLCLDNGEDSCTLRIASLARPARLVRRVRLDWAEWCEAVVKLGETFAADLEESTVPAASRRAVRERLRALRQPSRLPPPRPVAPLGLRIGAAGRALVLQLNDGSALLERAPRGHGAALGALLGSGRIWISGAPEGWQLEGPALLHVLELVRCGEEVQRALGTGVDAVEIQLPGGPSRVSLSGAGWALGSETLPWTAEEVARALLALGASAARAVRWAVPTQRRNPYLEELVTRSEAGLALLRPSTPEYAGAPRGAAAATGAGSAGRAPAPARGQHAPAAVPSGGARPGARRARARRPCVADRRRRRAPVRSGNGPARLGREAPDPPAHPARRGRGARRTGARRHPRPPPRATAGQDASPRWFQPHDGAALDPLAISAEQVLLFGLERRGIRAVDALTGRAALVVPAPTHPAAAHGALRASRCSPRRSPGVLTGLDLHDGTVRFRVAAPLPFTGPALPWGPVALVPLGREDRSALLALDPVLGEVRWLTELPLRHPTPADRRAARGPGSPASTRSAPPSPASTSAGGCSGSARSPVPERPVGVLRAGVELVVVGLHGRRGPGAARRQAGVAGGRCRAPPCPRCRPASSTGCCSPPGRWCARSTCGTGGCWPSSPAGRGVRALAVSPRPGRGAARRVGRPGPPPAGQPLRRRVVRTPSVGGVYFFALRAADAPDRSLPRSAWSRWRLPRSRRASASSRPGPGSSSCTGR